MSMMFLSFPMMILMLALGGENSLTGYLDTEAYWERQGVEFAAAPLRELLTREAKVDEDRVRALIRQLGHDDHAKRRAATEALADLGAPVRPYLKEGVGHSDPEIATRSKQILQALPADMSQWDIRRRMAIRGLGELQDRESLALLRDLAESDDPVESDLARGALDQIQGKESASVAKLETRGEVLARFPAHTQGLAQLVMEPVPSPITGGLREMTYIQDKIIELLDRIGDVRVDRITAAANREGFADEDDLRVMVLVEGHFNALRIAKWLMSEFDFQAAQEGDMVYLHHDHAMVWPMSDHRLFLVIHDREEGATADSLAIARGIGEPGDAVRFDRRLAGAVDQVEKDATAWAALLVPPEHHADVKEAELFETGWIQLWRKPKEIPFRVEARGEDEEKVTALVAERTAQLDEVIGEMANMRHGPVGPMVDMMKEIKMRAEEGPRFVLEGRVTEALLREMTNQMQQMSQMMMQREQRMNKHRHLRH